MIKTNGAKSFDDPPKPPGILIFFEILEYEDLLKTMKLLHEVQGHAPVETTLRSASQRYWHPEITLVVYEVLRNCRQYQLMKPPDPSLGNLRPIQPPPPLSRWGIDHTQVSQKILLNAVEYATGWLESRIVLNADFECTVPLLYIFKTFGTPNQIISDNANSFTENKAKELQRQCNGW